MENQGHDKFDWFIDVLREGETITISPYDYGDFLRYVKGCGLADEFIEKAMESTRKEIDDDAFPEVVELIFLNPSPADSDTETLITELKNSYIKDG